MKSRAFVAGAVWWFLRRYVSPRYTALTFTSVMFTRHHSDQCMKGNVSCAVVKACQVTARSPVIRTGRMPTKWLRARAVAPFNADTYSWTGTDEFTRLDDRKEQDPLPLPEIQSAKRIVLVRHGQSTWNAEGWIQGSTDSAVLTKKGQAQAATTHEMV